MALKLKVRADHIEHALAIKHKDDLWLSQVKTGPTQSASMGNLYILDGLAMKKSWAHPLFTGYEIKVSHSDFQRDDKWPVYRAYCHSLYFACPVDLIRPEELPADVGLIYYNLDKSSLRTVRKAEYRNIEIPREILLYILMSKVSSDRHPFFNSRREQLEAWVNDKEDRIKLGYSVSPKLQRLVAGIEDKKREAEREKARLEKSLDLLEDIRKIASTHGINVGQWNWEKRLASRLSGTVIEVALMRRMESVASELAAIATAAKVTAP